MPPPGGFAADLPGRRGGEANSRWAGVKLLLGNWLNPSPHPAALPPTSPATGEGKAPPRQRGHEDPSWRSVQPSPHPAALPPTSPASGEVKGSPLHVPHPDPLPPGGEGSPLPSLAFRFFGFGDHYFYRLDDWFGLHVFAHCYLAAERCAVFDC